MTMPSAYPVLPTDDHPHDLITSLQRGLTILELLANEPEGLIAKSISLRSGIHLSTCYHLLNTLIVAGYVVKLPLSQRFTLTDKLHMVARKAYDHHNC